MEENIKNRDIARKIMSLGLTESDFSDICNAGISLDKIENTMVIFKSGVPKIQLERPATINDGIIVFSEAEKEHFITVFESKKDNLILEKFVPASGAASRMFKFLSEFLMEFDPEIETINAYINRKNDTSLSAFIIGMEKFPFFTEVDEKLNQKYLDFNSWKRDKKNYYFIKMMLDENEFDFANKPKGILPFHKYNNHVATAIEEQLNEAILHVSSNNITRIHFTISEDHQNDFEAVIRKFKLNIEKAHNAKLEISFSTQQKSTDTIVVDSNDLFLRQNNKLVFRPGGHGALIHNLNNIESDIVFIKNIDNVSYNNLTEIVIYKKMLCGFLLEIQSQIFKYLHLLDEDVVSEKQLSEIKTFVINILKISINDNFVEFKEKSQIKYLRDLLNKPIRICGMVKNENEPGGGPFWVHENDGGISLQIIENSQIDFHNHEIVQIFQSATHFNPVDIVCGIKNYKEEKFNLLDFVDHNSGFIVEKSKNGIDYKAYELPGLWNGAMAKWITLFVEVPLLTFNPVKTVNDLLKSNHQPF
jgi:hypothetical protein